MMLITFCMFEGGKIYAQAPGSDSLPVITITSTDTISLGNSPKRKAVLDEIIKTTSADSVVYDLTNKKIIMLNKCVIDYGKIHLETGYAEIDLTTNMLIAKGLPDSVGNITQKPVYKDGEQQYNCETIKYNFNTGKGYITNVITQQDGGYYLHGEKIKKFENNITNLKNGSFTTCDLEHPHFQFRFTKGKLIPNDKIVTGLTYLEIQDIPLPVGIPFGIFPLIKGGTSGIVIPGYGSSNERGFFLENGGYYWHINDKYTLKVLGDIYSRGSWAIKPTLQYKVRYKFSGSFSFSFAQNKSGIRGSSNYTSRNDFKISWQHTQDPKANPNHSFSANVNFVTSKYNRLNPSTTTDYLSNTFNSSIAYQTSFFKKKMNFSINAGHTQNTLDGSMTFTLPDFSLSTTKLYPFKRRVVVGKERWYEKIFFSYSMVGKNELTSIDSLLFTEPILDKLKNGIKHTIPIGFTSKVFNVMQLNISANYTERWYSKYYDIYYEGDTTYVDGEPVAPHLVENPIYAFKTARDFNFNASLNTTLYGLVQFRKFFIRAIRHVFTPALSFNYTHDFGTSFWKYYDTYTDASGNEVKYSIFKASDYTPLYGYPSDGESGRVSFSFGNSLEIKVRNKHDTITGTKKIKLIESLTLSGGYDFAKDSLNWSNLSISGRTQLIKGLALEYSTSLCPYKVTSDGVMINQFLWKTDGRLFAPPSQVWRLGFTYTLNQDTFKGQNGKKLASYIPQGLVPLSDALSTRDIYIDWDNTWNVNISYNFNYQIIQSMGKDGEYVKTTSIVNAASFSGDVNITKKWKVGYNLKFDLTTMDLTYANLSVYRDLHCWEMRFNWVPFGSAKSWMFTINIKSAALSSIKYEKQKYDYSY